MRYFVAASEDEYCDGAVLLELERELESLVGNILERLDESLESLVEILLDEPSAVEKTVVEVEDSSCFLLFAMLYVYSFDGERKQPEPMEVERLVLTRRC